MFLLIEVKLDFDYFSITNDNFYNILDKITNYEGVHFIAKGEVVASTELKGNNSNNNINNVINNNN